MSKSSLLIDNIAFAKKHELLEGNLKLAECPRLTELLSTKPGKPVDAANIHYQLQGDTNSLGQHLLSLAIKTSLPSICQRCLEQMPLDIALTFNYLITSIESDEPEESDDIDLQEPSASMDLIALIEDEIIMALPIAPTHDNECGPQLRQSGEKPNPFAVLKGLIKP